MKQAHENLVHFALNELDAHEAEDLAKALKSDSLMASEVNEIRRVSHLMERALATEPMPAARSAPSQGLRLATILAATAAALALMIFALPRFHAGERSVSVEEEAFAESFSPGLDREAIRQVVRSHLAELRTCYEEARKVNPSLAGKILVHFSIGADGTVPEAFIKHSTLGSPGAESCIADHVKSWKFSGVPKDGKAVVDYPFIFSSK